MISLPRSTVEIRMTIWAARVPHCSPAVTSPFTWSTVQSSTMALTCAINEPISVRIKVMKTNHLYGLTKGLTFLKSWKRFMGYLLKISFSVRKYGFFDFVIFFFCVNTHFVAIKLVQKRTRKDRKMTKTGLILGGKMTKIGLILGGKMTKF